MKTNATKHTDSNGRTLERAEFKHGRTRYVAVRFNGGQTEVYRVVRGLEMWVRYASPTGPALDRAAITAVAGWRSDADRWDFGPNCYGYRSDAQACC